MPTNVIEIYRAPGALPATLKGLKGWLLWKLEQHHGESKPRKVPYYIDGRRRRGTQGGKPDLDALATLDRAALACSKGGYSGIGLAVLPQWGITAVDFDGVIVDGVIDSAVAALIAGTYSEVSPSGHGVRAFFLGRVPANRKDNRRSPQVEFFTSKGFVTVTGRLTEVCSLLGLDESLAPLTPEILALYTERFGVGKASATAIEDLDPHQVREMLNHVDPDGPHDAWLRIGLGLHHQFGADGFELWNEWSVRGTKYPGERTLRSRWGSIRNDEANPVTIATVRQAAREGGWVEDLSAEFEPLVDAEPTDAEVTTLTPRTAPADAPWPGLARDRYGRIEPTVGNLFKALGHEGMARMRLGYDQFRDEIMFSTDAGENWAPFKDVDYVTLRITLERRGFKPIGRELIRDVVARVAEDHRFDSAQQWLNTLAWDSVPRIDGFLPSYFGAEDTPYAQAIGAYTWTALAGRVMEPGCKADMAPILIGEQGSGKSSGVVAMAPARDFFCEISFTEEEADLARKMRGRLIAEIGELRGLHTRELEHIKAFVSRTHEDWIPKFKEFHTVFPRRLLLIGTTNQGEFLADETGNRRWLPIRVGRVDVEAIERDCLQLWAEGRDRFLLEGVAWSDAERLARDQHQAHMITDSWEDIVREWLDQVGADGVKNASRRFLRLNDVLRFALNFDTKNITRREELRVGRVLTTIGYEKKVVREGDKLFKAWVDVRIPF
ncbi:VapE domain-containing protein [Accumulibacter sp.]|uniref:VapE domain-containing protein n=1 Tax=Accumulibacter sp. TaxID=2053492 RepID=UPI0025FD10AD|nr:VapE domain-containing protein [Accumulibacter sp.]MCM8595157.1 PriCT-2 domain-containing protein [Accumulibacter sp.]MCM8626180.1 PriCT-2 domain-containing protein [Accumulibacter sp.]MDS4049303.1 VapE family protein [Accumulibacter sp.]